MKQRHLRKAMQRAQRWRAWTLINHPVLGRVWFKPITTLPDYGPYFRKAPA